MDSATEPVVCGACGEIAQGIGARSRGSCSLPSSQKGKRKEGTGSPTGLKGFQRHLKVPQLHYSSKPWEDMHDPNSDTLTTPQPS